MSDLYRYCRDQAPEVARLIQAAAKSSNEADFRRVVSRILERFSEDAGISVIQRDEYSLASGRADTIYNRLVVEYKAPGRLSSKRTREEAILQLQGYVRDIASKEKRSLDRMAGVILDGQSIIFVRFSVGTFFVDPPTDVNQESVELFLKYLASLSSGVAIVPENLIVDFGLDQPRTKDLVLALYGALDTPKEPIVAKMFSQWQTFFSEIAGYEASSNNLSQRPAIRSLAKTLEIRAAELDGPRLFYAIHTYYALLMKLMAWFAVAPFLNRELSFAQLASLNREQLKQAIQDLENGGVFREAVGIRNFLEGDFFNWYLSAWNDDVYAGLRGILSRLNDYDPETLELDPEQTRDLLKKLYQYLLPREIRHDLGEFYTPDWLAELTLNRLEGYEAHHQFEGDPAKRVLDPACGSGTFLVLTIAAVRRNCRLNRISDRQALESILANVVGIDLNPLAVIAARTNYLIAIRDLLPARESDIEIPVYLADSVVTPAKASDLAGWGNYRLRTTVGVFEIAQSIATPQRIGRLADLLDDSVRNSVAEEVFLKRSRNELKLDQKEFHLAQPSLAGLYKRLTELHRLGQNGIWSRVIKNAFAPMFVGEFDYVVGNPPWINWQSLPESYRAETLPLWNHFQLIESKPGARPALGRSKREIAALFVYVGMQRYLKPTGRLGFVITQSVLKTEANEGFRRFELPGTNPIRLRHADDFTRMQPFEDATNRTAVIVLSRGERTKYPVPYFIWERRGKSAPLPDQPFVDALKVLTTTQLAAIPSNAASSMSSWMTLRADLVPIAQKLLGSTSYTASEGVNTGGANGVFFVEIIERRPDGKIVVRNYTEGAKREVPKVETAVEPDLVHPLLRGRDVDRWTAKPSLNIIVPYSQKPFGHVNQPALQEHYPRTFAYVKRFEAELLSRRDLMAKSLMRRHGFHMFGGVSESTFAPFKVAWREIASSLTVSVVTPDKDGRPVVPDHKLMYIACESESEAHYLSCLLNSALARLVVDATVVSTQTHTGIVENFNIPRFDMKNPVHQRISKLGESMASDPESAALQTTVDEAAAEFWSVTKQELKLVRGYAAEQ